MSDSEAEDPADARISLAEGVKAANLKTHKKTSNQAGVRLKELGAYLSQRMHSNGAGPRLTLSLLKITEGFCDGEVLYHSYGNESGHRPGLTPRSLQNARREGSPPEEENRGEGCKGGPEEGTGEERQEEAGVERQ